MCRRDTFFEPAKTLFATGYIGKVKLMISSISILNAEYIGRKYGYLWIDNDLIDYEDAVQHKSAIKVNADCIVTRNKPDFLLSSIPVYTVEEILKVCENI